MGAKGKSHRKKATASTALLAISLFALLSLLLAAPALAAEPTHPRHEALDITGLNHACGVAVDNKGDVYASSAGESKVKVYSPEHKLLTEIADLNTPCSLAVTPTGVLYVSERGTGEVVSFKPNKYPFSGTPTYGAREVIDASGKAKGIGADSFDSALYVAEGERVWAYVHEMQTIALNGQITGGSFTLKFEGQETVSLPFNASAAEAQTALEGLSTIGAGNVEVSKPSPFRFAVLFTGKFAYSDVPTLGAVNSLTGTENPRVNIFETAKGFSGQIGEGVLSEATGVAPYANESESFTPEHYLWVADANGVAADHLLLFRGARASAMSPQRELTGATTPDGSFGFGAQGAPLAADPGNTSLETKKCAVVGEQACTAGHLYLYDAAHKALDEFDASGEYLDRTTSPAFSDAEPSQVAIDRSGASNDGTLYVTAGSGLGATALAFRPLTQPGREPLPEPISHALASAQTVATDPFGDVYASAGHKVSIFDPKGKAITSFEDKAGEPRDLAVDSKCNVYVLEGEATVTYYAPSPSACPPTTGTTYPTRHEPVVTKSSEFPLGNKSLRAIALNPGPSAGKDHLFVTASGITREYDSAANGSKLLNPEFASAVSGNRESIAVNGANGNVYFGLNINVPLIAVVSPSGKSLAQIDSRVSTSGKAGANPHLAVDQTNGHVIEFDGKGGKSAHEYDPATGGFVADFGNFTEGLTLQYRIALDNSCAIHEPPLTGKACEEFDPANGNAYVAFADTSGAHPPFNGVTAFGPLKYPERKAPTQFNLTVEEIGNGSGTVTSQSEGINCQPTCSHEFEEGTEVRLSESAKPNSEFIKWEGCDSEPDGTCFVTMNKARKIKAEFKSTVTATEELKVEIEPPGAGKVSSSPSGIECPPACSALYGPKTEVTLTEQANEGFKFIKWEGCDSEPGGTCLVTMNEARKVKVLYGVAAYPLVVKKEGNGEGTVTSSPAGISCGATCSHEFEFNKKVKLSQEAKAGSEFKGWGGACSGTGACEVTISEAKEVTATFKALPKATVTRPRPIAFTEATLRGEIQTAELETEYRFEYLTQEEFEENGESFEGARHTPEEALVPAKAPVAVQAHLNGLQEGTTYHFRLIAASSAGMVEAAGEFETLERQSPQPCLENAEYRTGFSVNLPDCRAYELVTPAQTDGLTPYVAEDGGKASGSFSNWLTVQHGADAGKRLSYFIDGTLPGFEGDGRLDGYRAEREAGEHPASGWQSVLVSPDYRQAGGGKPEQHGIATDQLYSIWESDVAEAFSGTLLPSGAVFLRTPEGFEALGKGDLGEDPQAVSRYVSSGGAHAIFSSAEHLEPGAPLKGTPGLYDRAAGATSAAVLSAPPAGASPALKAEFESHGATYLGASEDGAAIAFKVGGVLYLHRKGATVEIAEAPNVFAGLSEDGAKVFYVKAEEGSAPASLFTCDVEAGPCAGPGAQTPDEIAALGIFAQISPDGSQAFFSSEEVLTGEENENGEEAEAGSPNLYAWVGGEAHFVAVLSPSDFTGFAGLSAMNLGAWATRALGFGTGTGRAYTPTRSTPDGDTFVFQSHARLTAYENGGLGEIYRYDPAAEVGERLVCVSCDPTGAEPSADALLEDVRRNVAGVPLQPKAMIANLTDDGQKVFFQSFDQLLPEDVNEAEDVYEWEAKGAGGCNRLGGCLALISSGQGEANSYLYAMSASGKDVFFETRDKLVGADVAGSPSIYDAREGGGIPEPAEPAPCQGDACQGQGSEPPVLPTPMSGGPGEAPGGGEALRVGKPCAKGKHRVKGHCVAVKHKHKHRKRNRALAHRGGSR